MKKFKVIVIVMTVFVAFFIIGCGGGEVNSTSSPTPEPTDDIFFVPNEEDGLLLKY